MFVEKLKKAAHLSLLMENNSVLICQVTDYAKGVCNNSTEISTSEDYDYLSVNVQEIGAVDKSNRKLENAMKSSATAKKCLKLKKSLPEC